MKHWVGVDLGGSKIVAAVFERGAGFLAQAKRSTKGTRGAQEVAARVARTVRDAVDEADLEMEDIGGVGVGVPGIVDGAGKRVIRASRLGWSEFDLGGEVGSALNLPVWVGNAGILAAWAARTLDGDGRHADAAALFAGNGIRGGRIRGTAAAPVPVLEEDLADLGHWVLHPEGPVCACGRRGCLEALASRSGILGRLESEIARGRASVLAPVLAGRERLRSGDVRRAWESGDPLAREVVAEASRWLGIAVAELAGSSPPDVLFLGGGLLESLYPVMQEGILGSAREWAGAEVLAGTEIRLSPLGNLASASGAALFAEGR